MGESLRGPLMSVILLRDVGETDPKCNFHIALQHVAAHKLNCVQLQLDWKVWNFPFILNTRQEPSIDLEQFRLILPEATAIGVRFSHASLPGLPGADS